MKKSNIFFLSKMGKKKKKKEKEKRKKKIPLDAVKSIATMKFNSILKTNKIKTNKTKRP